MNRALIVGALLVAGCGATSDRSHANICRTLTAPPRAAAPQLRNVVVVTIDGVRRQEIFNGVDRALAAEGDRRDGRALLPNLYRLIDRGVALGAPGRGAPMLASGPNFVSLPGYREILTGRRAADCTDNDCGPMEEPTLLEEFRWARELPPSEVAAISSWETIERATSFDPRAITISAGRHGGVTRDGLRVSPAAAARLDEVAQSRAWPGHSDYRPDALSASLALTYLETKRPRFLYVSLGDTDEYAHRGDYAGYLRALSAFDNFLGQLMARVDASDTSSADTLFVVTSDHGRSPNFSDHGSDPTASPVWLVAAGGPIPARGLTPAARPRRLADIAPTVRALLGIPADDSPRAGAPIPELLAEAPGA